LAELLIDLEEEPALCLCVIEMLPGNQEAGGVETRDVVKVAGRHPDYT